MSLHQSLSVALTILWGAVFAFCPTTASPVRNARSETTPLAKLDYGTFQGAYSSTYNLSYFRRIPFGASTAGENRFRAPQPPLPITNGTYDSNQAFDMCPQRTVNGSEDCLYLGLYSRPWDRKALRPVLVTFYGGGFIEGSASFTIPPAGFPVSNVSEANDFVVVYPNYRTGVFGLLPGKEIMEGREVDLNPGLLDQQAALLWVQNHISAFGGDKTNVSIWGQSAGGGSVVAQTIATGNHGKHLFSKAMASSPFWPKTYSYDSPEAEQLYQQTVQAVGCANATDQITCLKSADLQALREVSLALSASHTYNTSSYTWAPVIDDSFLATSLTQAVQEDKINADAVFGTYNLHEGENFIPPGFANATGAGGFNSSITSFNSWLTGFLPDFSKQELDAIKSLYPETGTAEDLSYNTTLTRAGLIYRDLVLACPAYWLAETASKGYIAEYTISPAKHGSDTIYWNQVNAVQQSDPLTYTGYAGAMASFVQTSDPNAHKVTSASVPGVPAIRTGKEFVIESGALVNMGIGQLEKRCAFWLAQGDKVPI